MITPKEHFLARLGPESKFRNIMASEEMQLAIIFSLAEFIGRNPTTEQISGANVFVDIFRNIAEPPQSRGKFVDKRMKAPESFLPQPETPKK